MRIKLLLISLLLNFSLFAQQNNWNLAKPLDNLTLVSTFGELRPDHFHSGLDFSGHGHTGDPVYAIDDGYISRISVSSDGYGNALYITHPNGKKSVYGHLLRFIPVIQQYVEHEQYKQWKFEITIYPQPGLFKVKKGQIIGYVGSTGRSYGPHLHFEIRNALLDYPMNPLLFIHGISDHTPPRIFRYAVYPATDTSLVQGRKRKIILPATHTTEITTFGPVYFGIETYDFTDGHYNRKAVYDVRLFVDDSMLLWYRFDKFLFSHTRDVNTLMDYSAYIHKKFKIQRSLITPGNRLCIYKLHTNNGIFNPWPGRHKITYVVSDFFGNKARITFWINALAHTTIKPATKHNYTVIPYGKAFRLDTSCLTLIVSDTALYDSLHFHYSVLSNNFDNLSPLFLIQDYGTPLRWPIELRFRIKPKTDTNHLVVAYIDYKGNTHSLVTSIKNGQAIALSRRFGKFYLTHDTIKPQVKLISSWQLTKGQKLIFKISDNMSGIALYRVFVNRRWALFAYDAKTSTLSDIVSDRDFIKGKNHVRVYLSNHAGNIKTRDFLITVR